MRAFLAVSVADPGLDASFAAQGVRLPEGELRWVPAGHRHLTLRFFDELPEDRVEDVRAAAGTAAADVSRFEVELAGVGCFPPRGPAKVLWIGCGAGREELLALASAVSRALESRGFPADPRPFSPHLTLARARNRGGSSAVAAAVRGTAIHEGTLGRVPVDRLLLIRSTLGSGPPRHDVLGTFPLAV
ncbi:MAG: RNA 2',3'-cyclic phosphodiesterase [Thermoanaerobaculia bacterium]